MQQNAILFILQQYIVYT